MNAAALATDGDVSVEAVVRIALLKLASDGLDRVPDTTSAFRELVYPEAAPALFAAPDLAESARVRCEEIVETFRRLALVVHVSARRDGVGQVQHPVDVADPVLGGVPSRGGVAEVSSDTDPRLVVSELERVRPDGQQHADAHEGSSLVDARVLVTPAVVAHTVEDAPDTASLGLGGSAAAGDTAAALDGEVH